MDSVIFSRKLNIPKLIVLNSSACVWFSGSNVDRNNDYIYESKAEIKVCAKYPAKLYLSGST